MSELSKFVKLEFIKTLSKDDIVNLLDKQEREITQLQSQLVQVEVENNELREVENDSAKEIWALKAELKAERDCVDWYADIGNWQLRTKDETNVPAGYAVRISNHDADYVTPASRFFGGKRAREQQAKRTT